MKVIADLHVHSRFSRAVSEQMAIPVMGEWAKKKGISLVATADWTHPLWFRELQANLEEVAKGIYKAKNTSPDTSLFLLSTEISCIYSKFGKGRRIHLVILAPSLETVEKINRELVVRGVNLLSDGRPIVGLSAKNVAEIILGVDPRCLVIPAHAWTPHFSLYGSISGFDSIEECFDELSPQIYAIETGLSSDPAMNWRIQELGNRQIVSFSDAHSPQKMGREATIFQLSEITYGNIRKAIMGDAQEKIVSTIEFYPEEGKYHYTGHRNCQVVYSPNETRKLGAVCPVCGRPLTVGVMSRVEQLASSDVETKSKKDEYGVRWIEDSEGKRVPYVMMVPLLEILAEAFSVGTASQKALTTYDQLVNHFGSEFKVLLESNLAEIEQQAGEKVAEAIGKVRSGDIVIEPGYDGVFGKVKIWKEEKVEAEAEKTQQETLF